MNKIAHFFSWTLSPILMPTYAVLICMWVTVLSVLPLQLRWPVVGTVFLITCVVPALAILLMYWMGIISAPGLNNRTELLLVPHTCPYVDDYVYGGRSGSGPAVVHSEYMVENQCPCGGYRRSAGSDVPYFHRGRESASYSSMDFRNDGADRHPVYLPADT